MFWLATAVKATVRKNSTEGDCPMLVQKAPEREPSFVVTMKEHMDFCSQLARAYGNDRCERLSPYVPANSQSYQPVPVR
jgi:hypothetical protein